MDDTEKDLSIETTEKAEATTTETGEQSELGPEEVQLLKERAAKADEYWARLLREAADFDNFRKRAARERQEAVTYANEGLLSKLLPVLDAFDMAQAVASDGSTAAKSIQAGVAMVANQLRSILAEAGLEEIDAKGQAFNPNLHEAVSQEETTEAPDGHVLRQIRKGYRIRNRLLRPAGVIVARRPHG